MFSFLFFQNIQCSENVFSIQHMGYIFLIKTNRISQAQVMPVESKMLEKS